jgi:hypothetical protein
MPLLTPLNSCAVLDWQKMYKTVKEKVFFILWRSYLFPGFGSKNLENGPSEGKFFPLK